MNLKNILNRKTQSTVPQSGPDTVAVPKNGTKKKRIKKRWTILGVIVILVATLFITWTAQRGQTVNAVATFDTVVLARTDIEHAISATGTVESADSHTVYSTQSYPVKAVHVEVGDVVQEGDLLCELDTSALEDQIEAQELSTGTSAQAAAQQVKTARDNYNATKDILEEGLNTSIVSAENSVRATYDAWQKAIRTYDTYEESLDDDTNATLIQYDNAVNTASNTYDAAKAAYTAAENALESAQAALAAYTTASGDTAAAEAALAAAESDKTAKQSTRDNALIAYQAAEATYNTSPTAENQAALAEAKAFYENAEETLAAAVDAVEAAQEALAAAQGSTTSAQYFALQADVAAKQAALNAATTTRSNAKNAYDTARAQRSAAYDNSDTTLSDYARAVDTAYDNYNAALVSLEAAQKSAQTQLQSSKNSLSTAEISGNTDSAVLKLAQMQEDLDETRIAANASGTVTAVYAKVGASGSGLLFVIEDTQGLIVKTTVKGYDVGTVKEGIPVAIKSDATGDAVFDGKISSIAPTSVKNMQGQTDTASDVLFATEVAVLSKDTGLRIGMSVRLQYIIEGQADAIIVPYDAVYENANEESCILIVEERSGGKYTLRELAVTPGMENDLDVVITGEGVVPGLRVLSNPERYLSLIGREVTLSDQSQPATTAGFQPPFMPGG